MGTAAQRSVSREVHADVGYAHLSIPRLELVMWPRQLGGRPEHKRCGAAPEEQRDSREQGSGDGGSGGGGGSAVPDVTATWEGAEAASTAAADAAAGVAVVPASSELLQQPVCHQQRLQWQQEQQRWQEQQQQWHDLPVRVLVDSSNWQQAGPASPQGRQASLQLLNSHMASISGRWWDVYGARAGGGGIAAGWQQC